VQKDEFAGGIQIETHYNIYFADNLTMREKSLVCKDVDNFK